MQIQINDTCQVCKKKCEDMLMLACIHNPCVNCAALAYAEMLHIKNANPHIYTCEICRQETVLDKQTVNQLRRMTKQYVKVTTKTNNNFMDVKALQLQQQKSKTSPKSGKQPKKQPYFCKTHGEEELTYYCLSCNQNICSQCAIHGLHKQHQVKLIKKAVNEAKSDFTDIINGIVICQNQVNKNKEGYLRCLKEANERTKQDKELIAQEFEILRNLITNQQKQIIKCIEATHKENVIAIQNIIGDLEQISNEIEKTKKEIQSTLKKEDIVVLEEYKNLEKIKRKIQDSSAHNQTISIENSYINFETIQNQIKQIKESIKKIRYQSKKQMVENTSMAKARRGSVRT